MMLANTNPPSTRVVRQILGPQRSTPTSNIIIIIIIIIIIMHL